MDGRETVANFAIPYARLVPIRGVVVGRDNSPISGGYVRVARQTTSGVARALPGFSIIQPDGAFSLKVLAANSYLLHAQSGSPWLRAGVQKDVEAGTVTVKAGQDNISGVRVLVTPGATIHGQVVAPRGDRVTDVRTLRVFPVPLDSDMDPIRVLASTGVHSDGTFELRNVFGTNLLYLAGSSAVAPLDAVLVRRQDITDTGLTAGRGQRIRDVEIVLGSTVTKVLGIVADTMGRPASNCVVAFFSADERRWGHPLDRYTRVTRTGDDGSYAISSLPTGDFIAVAVPRLDVSDVRDSSILARMRSVGTLVRLGRGEQKQVALVLRENQYPSMARK
jgi:hypothetical protein